MPLKYYKVKIIQQRAMKNESLWTLLDSKLFDLMEHDKRYERQLVNWFLEGTFTSREVSSKDFMSDINKTR